MRRTISPSDQSRELLYYCRAPFRVMYESGVQHTRRPSAALFFMMAIRLAVARSMRRDKDSHITAYELMIPAFSPLRSTTKP